MCGACGSGSAELGTHPGMGLRPPVGCGAVRGPGYRIRRGAVPDGARGFRVRMRPRAGCTPTTIHPVGGPEPAQQWRPWRSFRGAVLCPRVQNSAEPRAHGGTRSTRQQSPARSILTQPVTAVTLSAPRFERQRPAGEWPKRRSRHAGAYRQPFAGVTSGRRALRETDGRAGRRCPIRRPSGRSARQPACSPIDFRRTTRSHIREHSPV